MSGARLRRTAAAVVVAAVTTAAACGAGGAGGATAALTGEVVLISGNCMPMMCKAPPCATSCRRQKVARDVLLLPRTQSGEVRAEDAVARTAADDGGVFLLRAPPGDYSVFVLDGGEMFCSRADGKGARCPLSLESGATLSVQLQVDRAVW